MANPDQPFEHALLYLRAAGHDTGAATRARLQQVVRAHRDGHPSVDSPQLLRILPRWFDFPESGHSRLIPPITRTSIGYPDD